jgi:superfamily I DNA/RNA helicase
MHRVKGLEFEHIIIAHVTDGLIPLKLKNHVSEDPVIRREREQIERSLLYVSATRAKKDVLITYYGKPSPFLTGNSPDTK